MQRPIQILSPQLANQIAAGEVVERPASVAKELLENSIDAGATEIEIAVEKGGLRLIRVLDNGHGIAQEQLPLAVAPHATSKLYSQQELEQIGSLGFRGEALASIASVSRFRLASHESGSEQGWEMLCNGKACDEPTPSALPTGTQIEVRDLFHSIPARRKFLRSERTEFLHLEEVVRRLALSRFDIAFTLSHNGRQVLRLRRAGDAVQQSKRVGDVLGRGFINSAATIGFEAAGLRLSGWLATTEGSRSQADRQYFYLNGRMIRDRLIQHAIRQAHQGLLEEGRHPAFVLFLELDPRLVDVNVHPTKHEVRFREPRLVHDFLQRALRDGLSGNKGDADVKTLLGQPSTAAPTAGEVAEQQAFYRQAQAEISPVHETSTILFKRYLLSDNGEAPRVLDVLAAHQHLLRTQLNALLDSDDIRSQPLLIPQSKKVGADVAEQMQAAADSYHALGFELDRLDEETVVLRRIPALLRGAETLALLDLLQWSVGQAPDAELTQEMARLVPPPIESHTALQGLLRQLASLPDSGEQFWRSLSSDDLQKLFESDRR